MWNRLNRIPRTIPRRPCSGIVHAVKCGITPQAHFLQKSSAILQKKHQATSGILSKRKSGLKSVFIPVLKPRLGILPDLKAFSKGGDMRLVPTPVASQLTGLSTEKLREWTNRRALVPADVRPKQKGSPAQFSWQTILVLRLAALLRDQFSVELESHKKTFAKLRDELTSTSFIALWGRHLALEPLGKLSLLEDGTSFFGGDAIIIHLDPHLAIIRDGFALPDAATGAGQMDLFSLPAMQVSPIAMEEVIGRDHRRFA